MNVNGTNAVAKVEQKKNGTLGSWLKDRKNEYLTALPKGTVEVDRFIQSAMLAITNPKQPDLIKCNKESLARALKEVATYGLDLSANLGQAFLIPYNDSVKDSRGNWTKEMTCHFQIGYKGLIALARRSNTIKTIATECIHENDDFSCELASGRSIHHKINIFADRGEVIGYYCLVELTNGGEQFAIMSKKDAEKFRDTYSKSYIMAKDKSSQNWGKNFDAMALKTCVIKALKLCPISVQALEAVNREEMSDIMGEEENNLAYEQQIEKNRPGKVIANSVEAEKVEDVEVTTPVQPAQNLAMEAVEMSAEEQEQISMAFDGDIF